MKVRNISVKRRDEKKREDWRKHELLIRINSGISQERDLEYLTRKKAMFKCEKLISKVVIRNRCQMTGRGRAVLSRYKSSRFVVRAAGSWGLLPGIFI